MTVSTKLAIAGALGACAIIGGCANTSSASDTRVTH